MLKDVGPFLVTKDDIVVKSVSACNKGGLGKQQRYNFGC